MKKVKSLLFIILTACLLTGCNSGKPEAPQTVVIDFENVRLETVSGGYPNILWGKEKAEDVNGTPVFDGILYSPEGAEFGSYYTVTAYGDYWSGFAFTSTADKTGKEGYSGQFSAYADSASKFAVGYDGRWEETSNRFDYPFITFDKPGTILSARFANSNYVYSECKTGKEKVDDFYFTLTLEGYNGTAKKGTVEIPLAKNGEILGQWEEFDLTGLGKIDKVLFSFDSNYTNPYGILIPKYFCIDDIKIQF